VFGGGTRVRVGKQYPKSGATSSDDSGFGHLRAQCGRREGKTEGESGGGGTQPIEALVGKANGPGRGALFREQGRNITGERKDLVRCPSAVQGRANVVKSMRKYRNNGKL